MIRYPRGKASGAERRLQGPTHYQWQVPGRPAPIHLSFYAIERLEADVMKGYWSVPKRGAEVGGILIGRTGEDGATVHIDDYEPVPCEYRRGPSYVLSEADRRRMEKALRRVGAGRQIVGFYRSHTRLGLYLDEQDYALIQSYFSSPQHVFLLVRPQHDKRCSAGFFFWEDGHIHRQSTYREFPFHPDELLRLSATVEEAPDDADAPASEMELPAPVAATAAPAPAAEPVAMPAALSGGGSETERRRPEPLETVPSRRQGRERRLSTRWAIAALVLVAFGLLEYAALRLFTRSAGAAALAASTPALRVERSGSYLQVSWNRNAPAVAQASRGVLSISDGLSRQDLELDPGQLRTGSVAYFASTRDVSFRLRLHGRTEVTESLRVVSPPVREEVARPRALAPPPRARQIMPVTAPAPDPVTKAQAKRPRPRRYLYDDGL